jgi:hypothetical protein
MEWLEYALAVEAARLCIGRNGGGVEYMERPKPSCYELLQMRNAGRRRQDA